MTLSASILAIDDDPKSLKLMKAFLSESDYEVITASNGLEAWQILTHLHEKIAVILLDRMMPGMDGIALNAKIKNNPQMSDIPVIMQTAAAEPEQVAEGIKAGVYYYLTKPYHRSTLIDLIHAAVTRTKEWSRLSREVIRYKKMLGLIERSDFSFASPKEARDLTIFLSNFFPDPQKVSIGLNEMLLNAIEHGNLGLGYAEKGILTAKGQWEAEIARRLKLPQYADKRVSVHYEKGRTEISLSIRDEGDGFDWRGYLTLDLGRARDNHGRGIAMSKAISFDEMTYSDKGNEVCCIVRL